MILCGTVATSESIKLEAEGDCFKPGKEVSGTSEAVGSNLGPGASCWKVGSYLPMPSGLQYSMHWFPPPVKLPIAK